MRICYVLLSPTFGMHQYTADLTNRMAQSARSGCSSGSAEVHLVTTTRLPRDRYQGEVTIHTPVDLTDTGFSAEGLRVQELRKVQRAIVALQPDLVHFSGPHLWNIYLMHALAKRGIPAVHTLHDLVPHSGTRYGALLTVWNTLIIRSARHILVHGRVYQKRLLSMGVSPDRVTCTPLLHLFVSAAQLAAPISATSLEYQPWALFFGRLERYKGVGCLLAACDMMDGIAGDLPRVVIAGRGNLSGLWAGPLPQGVEVRNHLISDEEAVDLFRRCGLVVLPYLDATQSALIAAAYHFRKPVVVTRTGALPEYVLEGLTGRIVEPDHPPTLARCLGEMLSDPAQLAEMGNAGSAWYDAQRAAEMQSLLAMYRRVADCNTVALWAPHSGSIPV